ncbi:hypothetical protein THAOC_26569 [Thalassiosira oceanica]|uniref:Uncharacterized protein n=1 Tax=Thalassiosira oceanica TaxID=159749 RepID=K0S4S4_THAOC|nr:hypothetical protein THAOC_26569 [Thalassiosira oceanica]|eukprot:EJK53902.1 hypothetical protein THAOC_26569 [Thalassiosira oceanica]
MSSRVSPRSSTEHESQKDRLDDVRMTLFVDHVEQGKSSTGNDRPQGDDLQLQKQGCEEAGVKLGEIVSSTRQPDTVSGAMAGQGEVDFASVQLESGPHESIDGQIVGEDRKHLGPSSVGEVAATPRDSRADCLGVSPEPSSSKSDETRVKSYDEMLGMVDSLLVGLSSAVPDDDDKQSSRSVGIGASSDGEDEGPSAGLSTIDEPSNYAADNDSLSNNNSSHTGVIRTSSLVKVGDEDSLQEQHSSYGGVVDLLQTPNETMHSTDSRSCASSTFYIDKSGYSNSFQQLESPAMSCSATDFPGVDMASMLKYSHVKGLDQFDCDVEEGVPLHGKNDDKEYDRHYFICFSFLVFLLSASILGLSMVQSAQRRQNADEPTEAVETSQLNNDEEEIESQHAESKDSEFNIGYEGEVISLILDHNSTSTPTQSPNAVDTRSPVAAVEKGSTEEIIQQINAVEDQLPDLNMTNSEAELQAEIISGLQELADAIIASEEEPAKEDQEVTELDTYIQADESETDETELETYIQADESETDEMAASDEQPSTLEGPELENEEAGQEEQVPGNEAEGSGVQTDDESLEDEQPDATTIAEEENFSTAENAACGFCPAGMIEPNLQLPGGKDTPTCLMASETAKSLLSSDRLCSMVQESQATCCPDAGVQIQAQTCMAFGMPCPEDENSCCSGKCEKDKETKEEVCAAPKNNDKDNGGGLAEAWGLCLSSGEECPEDTEQCCSGKCQKNKDTKEMECK